MNGGSEKAAFLREAEAMYEELRAWRERHPEASFDEIAAQVTPQRRKLMGVLLNQLSVQHGDGRYAEGTCPTCGERMEASGQRGRQVAHPEGETELERAYHRCPECDSGLFPPGRTTSSRES
jgi:DNA-directed RNA polymerase subunit RPC12/RpoP